ncbi:MAG: diguanylate cyclase [Planctomycetota bacterium]
MPNRNDPAAEQGATSACSSVILCEVAVGPGCSDSGATATLNIVAEALKGCLREDDIVARWGPEELVVLLDGAAGEDATLVAERLRAAVDASRGLWGCRLASDSAPDQHCRLSLGIATRRAGEELLDTVARADKQLRSSQCAA